MEEDEEIREDHIIEDELGFMLWKIESIEKFLPCYKSIMEREEEQPNVVVIQLNPFSLKNQSYCFWVLWENKNDRKDDLCTKNQLLTYP